MTDKLLLIGAIVLGIFALGVLVIWILAWLASRDDQEDRE